MHGVVKSPPVTQQSCHAVQALSHVRTHRLDSAEKRMNFGGSVHIEIAVQLNGLSPEDVTVEALFGRPQRNGGPHRGRHYSFACSGTTPNGEALFTLALTPELCGKLEYRIRIFPSHPSLIHKFETGLMLWL